MARMLSRACRVRDATWPNRSAQSQISTTLLDPGSHSNPPLDAPQAYSKRHFGGSSSPIALTYEEKLVNIEGRTARFGSFAEEGLEIAR